MRARLGRVFLSVAGDRVLAKAHGFGPALANFGGARSANQRVVHVRPLQSIDPISAEANLSVIFRSKVE